MTEKSQNFLKFEWKGQLYKYTAFPNGLACCPRLFTKLLKPVMAQLHRWGFISTIFIDDTLLMGDSELECVQNVKASLCLFEKLGFVIHPEKSVLAPTHVITYLGFEINSVDMTVTLMREKKRKNLQHSCILTYNELLFHSLPRQVHRANSCKLPRCKIRSIMV